MTSRQLIVEILDSGGLAYW